MPPSPPAGTTLAAIGSKLVSIALFAVMAALVKALGDRYPVGQIIFCRSIFAMIPVLWLIRQAGGFDVLRTRRPWGHVRRSAAGLLAMVLSFTALTLLPLPTATALGFAAPIFTTILAIPLLGEKVRIYRWSAVIIGFLGILLIVRPTGGGSALGAGLALGAAAMTAFAMIAIRQMARQESNIAIVFYFTLTCAIAGGLSLPFAAVMPADWQDSAMLIGIGLFGGGGQIFMTRAYRMAPVSVIAPMDYTSLLFALAIGWIVWGEGMTPLQLAGAGIVIGSALFIAYRERRRRTETAGIPPSESPS